MPITPSFQVALQPIERFEKGFGYLLALHLLERKAGIVRPLLIAKEAGQRFHGVVARDVADLLEGIGPIDVGCFGRLNHFQQRRGIVGAHGRSGEQANQEARKSEDGAHICFPSGDECVGDTERT